MPVCQCMHVCVQTCRCEIGAALLDSTRPTCSLASSSICLLMLSLRHALEAIVFSLYRLGYFRYTEASPQVKKGTVFLFSRHCTACVRKICTCVCVCVCVYNMCVCVCVCVCLCVCVCVTHYAFMCVQKT